MVIRLPVAGGENMISIGLDQVVPSHTAYMIVSGWLPGSLDTFSAQNKWARPDGSANKKGSVDVKSGELEILMTLLQVISLVWALPFAGNKIIESTVIHRSNEKWGRRFRRNIFMIIDFLGNIQTHLVVFLDISWGNAVIGINILKINTPKI